MLSRGVPRTQEPIPAHAARHRLGEEQLSQRVSQGIVCGFVQGCSRTLRKDVGVGTGGSFSGWFLARELMPLYWGFHMEG